MMISEYSSLNCVHQGKLMRMWWTAIYSLQKDISFNHCIVIWIATYGQKYSYYTRLLLQ